MSKTVHVTLANATDRTLTQTAANLAKGDWTPGYAAPSSIDAMTAAEWQSEGGLGGTEGSVAFSLGDDGAQLTIVWRTHGGLTYDFDLTSGWELLGEIGDGTIALNLAPTQAHVVTGFVPSTQGFAFPNEFPDDVALRKIDLGLVKIPIGKASNGLCGGMAFAVRDYFEAGRAIPAQTDPPVGDALFEYLVQRLEDSFDLPHLPATLLAIMNPAYPDADGGVLNKVGADGRARVMARNELAKLRATIDAGKPCPICIVKVKSMNPADLGQNHQVTVYGYQVDGTQLTLWIYDPNNPGHDDAGFVLDIGHTDRLIEVGVSLADLAPIYCYVVTNYRPADPPADA
jgi:hypothetical protein